MALNTMSGLQSNPNIATYQVRAKSRVKDNQDSSSINQNTDYEEIQSGLHGFQVVRILVES